MSSNTHKKGLMLWDEWQTEAKTLRQIRYLHNEMKFWQPQSKYILKEVQALPYTPPKQN